jgi:GNAT superfamily N-acetyltransferase
MSGQGIRLNQQNFTWAPYRHRRRHPELTHPEIGSVHRLVADHRSQFRWVGRRFVHHRAVSRPVLVTHLLRRDAPAAAELLALAFADDPYMTWICPGGVDHIRAFMDLAVGFAIDHGHAYVTVADDGTPGAAALWMGPDARQLPDERREYRQLYIEQRGDIDVLMDGFRLVAGAHPTAPHFYLNILGSRPELRGRGLGAALLEHITAECDRQGLPAYLESSNPRNMTLYHRHGFVAGERVYVPDDSGVFITPMWREPG